MDDSRSNQIIIITLLLALGLFVEVLKSIRHSRITGSHEQMILDDADISPFHVSENQMLADRIQAGEQARLNRGMHVMGSPAKKQSYDFSGGRVAMKKGKANVTKKKKTVKLAKKTKNARGRMQQVPEMAQTAQINPNDNNSAQPPPPAGGVATGAPRAGGAVSPNGGVGGGANDMSTYSDWVNLLLPTTTQATVAKLVQDYQHDQVSSAVFYQLLAAMAAQPTADEEMLALYAANATPSASSFSFLVSALKTDSGNSSVMSADAQYIDAYSTLNEVPLLKQIFSQSLADETVILTAAEVLNVSTTTYLASRTPTSTPTPGATGASPQTSLVDAYNGFIPVIEHVLTVYAGNATIVADLQKSLALIKVIEPTPASS